MNNSSSRTHSSLEGNNSVSDYLQFKSKNYTIPEFEQEIITLEQQVKTTKDKIRDTEDELKARKMVFREDSIKKIFNKFIIRQSEIVQKAVYLNEGLLRFVVKSYYDDIHRYKDYSGTTWANSHKQAAYTIKWMVRFKPVQIKEECDNENDMNDEVVDINLTFALVCGFSFLNTHERSLISTERDEVKQYNSKNPNSTKESFYDKLLYILRYRPFSGKQLVSIFEALALSCHKAV